MPEPRIPKIGYAIVGLGKFAIDQILPAFAQSKYARPAALVSGDPAKARAVAASYGIDEKHVYDYKNYDMLRDDPSVDAVVHRLAERVACGVQRCAPRRRASTCCAKSPWPPRKPMRCE